MLEGVGARYFDDCNEARILHEKPVLFGGGVVAPWALDAGNAERLWDTATELLKPG